MDFGLYLRNLHLHVKLFKKTLKQAFNLNSTEQKGSNNFMLDQEDRPVNSTQPILFFRNLSSVLCSQIALKTYPRSIPSLTDF